MFQIQFLQNVELILLNLEEFSQELLEVELVF